MITEGAFRGGLETLAGTPGVITSASRETEKVKQLLASPALRRDGFSALALNQFPCPPGQCIHPQVDRLLAAPALAADAVANNPHRCLARQPPLDDGPGRYQMVLWRPQLGLDRLPTPLQNGIAPPPRPSREHRRSCSVFDSGDRDQSFSRVAPAWGCALASRRYNGLIHCSEIVGDFARVMRTMRKMRISVVACVQELCA
jgi:hypothetical protein